MKDDDKFYDSRRTKAVNKLILLWREGRPREIQRISNATIKPPKCSLSILQLGEGITECTRERGEIERDPIKWTV